MVERREIKLAGASLGRSRHICAFFKDKDEEHRVLLPFIKDGFEEGDRGFHIVDGNLRDDHLQRLKQAGIDVEEAQRSGQLEVKSWDDAYRRGGRFDQDAMLALIREILDGGRARGYPLTRLVAHMEWALGDLPGVHDIVEYEARLNDVLRPYDDPVICAYDSNRFGGRVVLDVLRTHPAAIVGGVLQVNPFYVPPDEFLKELRSRKS
jgi:hypothetical protein